jgi:hypothetical protein
VGQMSGHRRCFGSSPVHRPFVRIPFRRIYFAMASALHDLVNKISTEVRTVTKLLEVSSLPAPSFAERGAEIVGQATGLSAEDELALIKARNDLVNSATDLLHLAQGPVDHMVNLAYAVR